MIRKNIKYEFNGKEYERKDFLSDYISYIVAFPDWNNKKELQYMNIFGMIRFSDSVFRTDWDSFNREEQVNHMRLCLVNSFRARCEYEFGFTDHMSDDVAIDQTDVYTVFLDKNKELILDILLNFKKNNEKLYNHLKNDCEEKLAERYNWKNWKRDDV